METQPDTRTLIFLSVQGAGQPTFLNALFRHEHILLEKRRVQQYLPLLLRGATKRARNVNWLAMPKSSIRASGMHQKKAHRCLRRFFSSQKWIGVVAELGKTPFPGLDALCHKVPDSGSEQSWTWVNAIPGLVQPVVVLPALKASERNSMAGLSGLRHFQPLPLVVLNKADQIVPQELDEVRNAFYDNLLNLGWEMLPWVFLTSGVLEKERMRLGQERRNHQQAALNRFDTEFDRLRLALYEFEASTRRYGVLDIVELFSYVPSAALSKGEPS